jgi:hypothetical protein
MTAEIAILNRSALALAADSAVTISIGGKTKVYDTAEKLFEFSKSQPIALMIYNNVEFVGVPLDVLIRKFRDEQANDTVYESISDAVNHFLEYLSEFDHDISEEQKYLYMLMHDRFRRIDIKFRREVTSMFREMSEQDVQAKWPSPEDLLMNLVQQEIEVEKRRALKGYLSDVTLAQFRQRFGNIVCRALANAINAPIDTNDTKMQTAAIQLSYRVMKSSHGSDMLTGLVFGGFAENDIFPTLRYLEIDGTFFGKIKILSENEVDIDRRSVRAEVVPFAQKEMVERFMYGMDSSLESDVKKFVDEAIKSVSDKFGGNTKSERTVKNLQSSVDKRFQSMIKKLKDDSRQDLLDIVYFMSKKELADIAYALVELTSHKRRFSTDEQSVGGPIDVAILTKSEGLVWIKRKHYFTPDVNQGYYARMFGRAGGSHGGPEA